MNIASQVTDKNIVDLDETKFTKLVNNLLNLETAHHQELVIDLSIPSKENTPDDGEDGRLSLDNTFPINRFIKYID